MKLLQNIAVKKKTVERSALCRSWLALPVQRAGGCRRGPHHHFLFLDSVGHYGLLPKDLECHLLTAHYKSDFVSVPSFCVGFPIFFAIMRTTDLPGSLVADRCPGTCEPSGGCIEVVLDSAVKVHRHAVRSSKRIGGGQKGEY